MHAHGSEHPSSQGHMAHVLSIYFGTSVNLEARGQIPSFGQPSSSREDPLCPWKNLIWPRKNIIFNEKPTISQSTSRTKVIFRSPKSHINTHEGHLIWISHQLNTSSLSSCDWFVQV